jgi:hypothetical protein
MKKIIISMAIFAFGFANAQETKFGVKGGFNLSNLTPSEGAKSLLGFNIGGFAEVKLNEKFAIQPELLFSTQGSKFDIEGSMIKNSLSYLNIPVMFKYYVADKFNVEAGPQIGVLMSAKLKGDGDSLDIKDAYKSIDFGVNCGVGYSFSENISAGLRYNLGLSNILKSIEGETTNEKNSVIQLSVGYKF